MRRLLSLLLAPLALLAVACGDGESTAGSAGSETGTTATRPQTSTATSTGGCRDVEQPEPRKAGDQKRPKERLDPKKTWTAVMRTSCGTIEIRLDAKENPKTASSFAALARNDFYDGLTFHRVVPGFVIQGGDPTGTGNGDPGYSVVEAPPEDTKYTKGVVAMAKTELEEPGTSGSQFYIVTADDAGLPPDYAVVGEVTKGMDVVEEIGNVPNDPAKNNEPTEPVVIDEVTIREG